MPYIHVTLASGRPREVKRQLIGGLTDTMERVLEVARSDIHVLLWEIPTENILVLIKSLTDVVEAALQVARDDVHLVVLEEPFTRIGEAGIPMEPRRVPHWYYHDTVARHDR